MTNISPVHSNVHSAEMIWADKGVHFSVKDNLDGDPAGKMTASATFTDLHSTKHNMSVSTLDPAMRSSFRDAVLGATKYTAPTSVSLMTLNTPSGVYSLLLDGNPSDGSRELYTVMGPSNVAPEPIKNLLSDVRNIAAQLLPDAHIG